MNILLLFSQLSRLDLTLSHFLIIPTHLQIFNFRAFCSLYDNPILIILKLVDSFAQFGLNFHFCSEFEPDSRNCVGVLYPDWGDAVFVQRGENFKEKVHELLSRKNLNGGFNELNERFAHYAGGGQTQLLDLIDRSLPLFWVVLLEDHQTQKLPCGFLYLSCPTNCHVEGYVPHFFVEFWHEELFAVLNERFEHGELRSPHADM